MFVKLLRGKDDDIIGKTMDKKVVLFKGTTGVMAKLKYMVSSEDTYILVSKMKEFANYIFADEFIGSRERIRHYLLKNIATEVRYGLWMVKNSSVYNREEGYFIPRNFCDFQTGSFQATSFFYSDDINVIVTKQDDDDDIETNKLNIIFIHNFVSKGKSKTKFRLIFHKI